MDVYIDVAAQNVTLMILGVTETPPTKLTVITMEFAAAVTMLHNCMNS